MAGGITLADHNKEKQAYKMGITCHADTKVTQNRCLMAVQKTVKNFVKR